jgi:hypothetical protein
MGPQSNRQLRTIFSGSELIALDGAGWGLSRSAEFIHPFDGIWNGPKFQVTGWRPIGAAADRSL